MKHNMKEDLIHIRDFAPLVGVDIHTLRRWHYRGVFFPISTIGGARYYSKEQVDLAKQLRDGVIPGYVTSKEVCSDLGVSREALYSYIEQGFLVPDRSQGKKYFFLPGTVEAFKQSREIKP